MLLRMCSLGGASTGGGGWERAGGVHGGRMEVTVHIECICQRCGQTCRVRIEPILLVTVTVRDLVFRLK